MCWAWAVPSSSAGTLTTAREGGRGGEGEGDGEKGPVCKGAEGRDRPTVIAIYLYRHPNRHNRPIWKRTGALWWRKTTLILDLSAQSELCYNRF